MPTAPIDACLGALSRALGASASCAAERLQECAWDFGGIVHRPPAAVVKPESIEQLQLALRICTDSGVSIATRGTGHSQSGQSLTHGVVLDLKGLNSIELEPERSTGWLQAGATWHDVANAAYALGMLPVGLTTIVDTTVGGTLSVGGIGCESFRSGTQSDQVLELEVATLDGRIERCSATENRALFDAVRAGLGTCGIITRARYPLRPARERIRTYAFGYDDPHDLSADMARLSSDAHCDFMFGLADWVDGQWQAVLLLGKQFDSQGELGSTQISAGLRYSRELPVRDAPQWSQDGAPGHAFFRRFGAWPAPPQLNPWVGFLLAPDAAGRVLQGVFDKPAICPRAGSDACLLGVAHHADRTPLLMSSPSAGPLINLNLFPEPRSEEMSSAAVALSDFERSAVNAGGKCYLVGACHDWTPQQWSAHYGSNWKWLCDMKRREDPEGLLNPGSIAWP